MAQSMKGLLDRFQRLVLEPMVLLEHLLVLPPLKRLSMRLFQKHW
jgi:hypothetical protein